MVTTPLINFRDFGGQALPGGKRVRSDRLYRCGAPANVEPLLRHEFARICDLRHPSEVRQYSPAWPEEVASRVLFLSGVDDGNAPHLGIVAAPDLSPDVIDRYYLDLYRSIPFDATYSAMFSTVISALGNADGRCLIYCAAGKDRTGILAALILGMLGVSRDEIVADYLLSSGEAGLQALVPMVLDNIFKATGVRRDATIARSLLDVKPEYLLATLDVLHTTFGSITRYLEQIGASTEIQKSAIEVLIE
jgi:protein-tyrosine phosphatase